MSTERIIITWTPEGIFRGAAKWNHGGEAEPVQESDLALFGEGLNSGLLARIAELEAQLAAAQSGGSSSSGISKLTLKRRLDALGKWAEFKSFLATAGAEEEFILASEIRTSDPMFQALAAAAQHALGLSDAEMGLLVAP